MIACQACGAENPLDARHCRSCGTKLVVTQRRVLAAVAGEQSQRQALRWFERGRSLLVIGLFLLTCAVVLRYIVVPPMPPADIPPVDVGGILPDSTAAP